MSERKYRAEWAPLTPRAGVGRRLGLRTEHRLGRPVHLIRGAGKLTYVDMDEFLATF